MKKADLSKLALIGLSSGILASCGGGSDTGDSVENPIEIGGQTSAVSEDQLLPQLSASSKALYESLDADSKELVLKVAATSCAGQNQCAGLNGCKTATNDCAGQGACKGQGGCAVTADDAVKQVVKKMAEQRAKLNY